MLGLPVSEEFPSNKVYSTRNGFPMHKAVLVIYAKRLWNHIDPDRAMVLNCCFVFFFFNVYKALNIMTIEEHDEG